MIPKCDYLYLFIYSFLYLFRFLLRFNKRTTMLSFKNIVCVGLFGATINSGLLKYVIYLSFYVCLGVQFSKHDAHVT